MNVDACLRARDVGIDLGGRPVLRGVDLTIHRGELLALLGPNGAGKTTLLRCLTGVLRPRRGAVEHRPRTRDDWSPVRRGTLGYVPQRHDVAWELPLTVREAVLSGRVARRSWWRGPGVADHRATRVALERVGLDHLAARPIGELSGGQRQRVLIARALVLDSEVLLLDEPFTGLDVPAQERLTALFSHLCADGAALVMTTHDIAGALAAADRIALVRGHVRGEGSPADLHGSRAWAGTFEVDADSAFLAGVAALTAAVVRRESAQVAR